MSNYGHSTKRHLLTLLLCVVVAAQSTAFESANERHKSQDHFTGWPTVWESMMRCSGRGLMISHAVRLVIPVPISNRVRSLKRSTPGSRGGFPGECTA